MPVPTYSGHYIVDEGFGKAIQDFVQREAAQVSDSQYMHTKNLVLYT